MEYALPTPIAPTLAVGADPADGRASGDGRTARLGGPADLAVEQILVDLHPGCPARRWAAERGLPVRAVARHHALVAAVMVAHGLGPDDEVIGFAFDGGGYGPDGTTWGGEVLVASYKGVRRFAHLAPVRYAGVSLHRATSPGRPEVAAGAAGRGRHRLALAYLRAAGVPWDLDLAPVRACPSRERRVLAAQLDSGHGCGTTSSMGMLLDSLAAITGGPGTPPPDGPARPYPMTGPEPADLVRGVVADVRAGVAADRIAARIRATVADLVADLADRCRDETGLDRVVLAGDALADPAPARRLATAGFTVLTRAAPLPVGQLAIAAAGG